MPQEVVMVDNYGNPTATGSPAQPTTTRVAGGGTLNPGQVNVTASATLILAANANRRKATITNATGVTITIGTANTVTTANGAPLPTGNILVINSTAAVWGIAAAAGPYAVGFVEESN